MKVERIQEDADKERAIDGWAGNGISRSDLHFILDEMLSSGTEWHVISDDNGINIAVFDVRSVPFNNPTYHKSLHIYFAPGLNPDDGQDAEEVDKLIEKTVQAMAIAFRYMLDGAKETKERLVKIYSDHPYKLSIFREFISFLTKAYPKLYRGKLYGKWVEIQHI